MKQLIIAILFIPFALVSCASNNKEDSKENSENATNTAPGKQNFDFYVGFYNVENLFDTEDHPEKADEEFTPEGKKKYTEERYQKKLMNLSLVIRNMIYADNLSLLGLCEVENRKVVKDLVESPNMTNSGLTEIIHKDSRDGRGIDVAAVYNPDEFEVISYSYYKVTLENAKRPNTRDILYIKGVPAWSKDTLHAFFNHWPSRYGGAEASEHKRLQVATVVRSKIDSIKGKVKNPKILLMGDMNDYPTNKSVTEIINAGGGEEGSDGHDFYNLTWSNHANDKGTYCYKGDWHVIDQIIASNELYGAGKGLHILPTPNAYGIVKHEWMLYINKEGQDYPSRTYGGPNYYGGYSDHLPVWVRITYRGKPKVRARF